MTCVFRLRSGAAAPSADTLPSLASQQHRRACVWPAAQATTFGGGYWRTALGGPVPERSGVRVVAWLWLAAAVMARPSRMF